MHDTEADTKLAQYRPQHPANGALFGPDLDGMWLRLPQVSAVEETISALRRVSPSADEFQVAGLINNPFPRNLALFASDLESAIDDVHFVHAAYMASGKQLV